MQDIDFFSLTANPVVSLFLFFSLSLLPFAVLGLTSFLKFSVVFSILRNALGAGQLPGAAVSSLLAVILSLQVMEPVFTETRREIENSSLLQAGLAFRVPSEQELEVFTLPWRNFLLRHAGNDEISHFRKAFLVEKKREDLSLKETTELSDFYWLIPSFVLTELKEAFIIGFALFIPFVVVDLLVTNLLVGLGMMMVSPTTIALPIKILLFVSCDGWLRLSSSLLAGYR